MNNKANNNIQSKSQFIIDILDFSLKKKVDDKTKKRLVKLIGKEIEKTTNLDNGILERLEKLECPIFWLKVVRMIIYPIGFIQFH